jgi:hypothetical protein
MTRLLATILTLALITGCTTLQEIKRPGGEVEYLIACGASLGWNICYDRANQVCPTCAPQKFYPHGSGHHVLQQRQ